MASELVKDVLGDLPGWVALFLRWLDRGAKTAEALGKVLEQRMPKMFGIGLDDERILEALLKLLPVTPQDKPYLIELAMNQMKDYEALIFRLVITGMPCGNTIVSKQTRDPRGRLRTNETKKESLEFTTDDLRVKFLNEIADEIVRISNLPEYVNQYPDQKVRQAEAALEVVARMRARRLITGNRIIGGALDAWAETVEWVSNELLSFFKVNSLGKITRDLIAQKIEELARSSLPARPNGWAPSFAEVVMGNVTTTIAPRGTERFLAGARIAAVVAIVLVLACLAIWAKQDLFNF